MLNKVWFDLIVIVLFSKNVPIGQAKYIFWSFRFYVYDSFTANKNPYVFNN